MRFHKQYSLLFSSFLTDFPFWFLCYPLGVLLDTEDALFRRGETETDARSRTISKGENSKEEKKKLAYR